MFSVPSEFRELYKSAHPSNEPQALDIKSVLWQLLRQAGDVHIIDGLDESTLKIQREVVEMLV